MTRHEFDRYFAATEMTTEDYSREDLTEINDAVFASVADLDIDNDTTKSVVDHSFERVFFARDVAA